MYYRSIWLPMAKALQDNFGVVEGWLLSTLTLVTKWSLDHRGGDAMLAEITLLFYRSNSTGAAKAISLVIPSQTVNLMVHYTARSAGSVTELVAVLERTLLWPVNAAMRNLRSYWIMRFTRRSIVSSDIVGMSYHCSTQLKQVLDIWQ